MADGPREGEVAKQTALTALRQAIAAGDVAPGQRLVESELAEMFEVTRASVRAALIELTADGLVERIPNRGARVRVVTVDEAVAITECRMVLEGLCAAKAAELATDEQIGQLTELAERMRQAVEDGEPLKYSVLNRDLHRMVQEYSGQTVAAELLHRLNAQIVRHQFQLALRSGRPHVSVTEHLAIVAAIADRDPVAAEAAARAHLRSVIDALREPVGGNE
ncbi:MAG TPA: GntR family transcriptional regulator [Pseudonocardiaceae bacterium]|jgi:DNA-binding GntR family transcriptional regulator|nr:GntR family transcriptional regulator [Pseudonocardiaceae bacterium]